jgi:hypothetical protein
VSNGSCLGAGSITITEATTMNTDGLWALAFLAAVIAIRSTRLFVKKSARVFVPDYQRGVRFVDGVFREVMGPGSYNAASANEQITIVDMRPQPIVVERILYQDALQTPSVISIGAELSVADPYQATTKLKNLINDSSAIVRDALRGVVSKRIADISPEVRSKTATDIAAVLNEDLRKCGMQVTNVEITEFWSRTLKPHPMAGAN